MSPNQQSTVSAPERVWLVTGAAGFIGSHLVEHLLSEGCIVVGLDNFATGFLRNLEDVRRVVGEAAWSRFTFIEGDIRDVELCARAMKGVDIVLHQAALGSVPRSLQDPAATHSANLTGFLNVLIAARDAGVTRFVFAGSSSTYGDSEQSPKVESRIGRPLSPYAVTKYANELYARVFADAYGMQTVGLRYFNVFGPRQDPNGAYAAVIPRWVGNLLEGRPCLINGDGETTRDFSYVANVVQANIRAALSDVKPGEIYNVACGESTSLNQLFELLRNELAERFPDLKAVVPEYSPFRAGDIRHSHADIAKIRADLGYEVSDTVRAGLAKTVEWYVRMHTRMGDPTSPVGIRDPSGTPG